jgi:hypothetical protein
MWKHYGEDAIPSLRKHWPGLLELQAWFDRHADPSDGLLITKCYGDWMGFKPESGNGGGSLLTPSPAVTAFYHVLAMRYLAELAGALGNSSASAMWASRHAHGQQAYHARYYDPKAGGYSPCKAPPPAPQPSLPTPCKAGTHVDTVTLPGDDGSCDCAEFCASDWTGGLRRARPHWRGATSLYAGTSHDKTTPCTCVQAARWCPKGNTSGGCETICRELGAPQPVSAMVVPPN